MSLIYEDVLYNTAIDPGRLRNTYSRIQPRILLTACIEASRFKRGVPDLAD